MNISRHGREHYDINITTTPPITAWEASFDQGATWVTGTALTGEDVGWFRWLIAGPDADPGTAIVLPLGSCTPLGRGIDTPEIVVRDLPRITIR